MNIIELFTNPLILSMFSGAVIIGTLIAVCASLLGVTLVLKKYSMLGDGLAHIGFGAMAVSALTETILQDYLGKILGDYSILITVPIVIIAAVLIMKIGERGKLLGDSAIAIVSTSALALGYIIFRYSTGKTSDVCSSMFGSASLLTPSKADIIITLVLSAFVIIIFAACYNKMFSVTFDETFAKSTGIRTERYKTLIAVLAALTTVIGMKMLGTVMISGLIVFPAVSSIRICKTFKCVIICSAVISAFCSVTGIICAFLINNMPIGPCVVLVNLAVYIGISVFGFFQARSNRDI